MNSTKQVIDINHRMMVARYQTKNMKVYNKLWNDVLTNKLLLKEAIDTKYDGEVRFKFPFIVEAIIERLPYEDSYSFVFESLIFSILNSVCGKELLLSKACNESSTLIEILLKRKDISRFEIDADGLNLLLNIAKNLKGTKVWEDTYNDVITIEESSLYDESYDDNSIESCAETITNRIMLEKNNNVDLNRDDYKDIRFYILREFYSKIIEYGGYRNDSYSNILNFMYYKQSVYDSFIMEFAKDLSKRAKCYNVYFNSISEFRKNYPQIIRKISTLGTIDDSDLPKDTMYLCHFLMERKIDYPDCSLD